MAITAPILVLQHVECEPPAAYEDELIARGLDLHRVHVDLGGELPDWHEFSAIVAMGGPMGAYEDEAHSWLSAEKLLIAQAVRAGKPYWGVCLGAQLLAASLGARVAPGPLPEIGVPAISLTAAAAEDPVFSAAPPSFPALSWHGDTYELPAGAVRLAGSEQYSQQAFVVGRAYGLQFHLEVTAELAVTWADVPAYAEEVERVHGPNAMAELSRSIKSIVPESVPLARSLFGRWLELVVEPAQQGTAGPGGTARP
jgi:GMP synthase-like glutamine amidotransferase